MWDCIPFLYEISCKRYPFQPDSKLAQEQQALRDQLKQCLPEEHWHTFFLYSTCSESLDYASACHAYLLGLDLGLAIAHAAAPLQQDDW